MRGGRSGIGRIAATPDAIVTTASDWGGRVGAAWAIEHRRTERAFAGIAAVLDAAIAQVAPVAGVALDIGCGVGSTALSLARSRPGLSVVGADLSGDLVAVARSRADGVPNAAFVHGDAGSVATARAPIDLAVSRHGVMFVADPVAAFSTLRAAMRPGAPLLFSTFRARAENDWSTAVERVLGLPTASDTGYVPGPYGLSDANVATAILARAGWQHVRADPYDVRYVVGAGDDAAADALAFYRRIGPAAGLLAAAAPDERRAMERRLLDMLRERTHDGVVAFTAAIRIWHADAAGEAA
ncbi:hypothetical protein ASG29_11295 [Sphingomonas sp. Leaf412]|uniref:class I SAM-dependent methyltransferase n=1 Tax=Sphingomonas sp. Leaf412 TaxID=1736370 RepID=UPI0006FD2B01|nr:class I SAM-dependent methyltransferase [Sphingomonas sp. Leaf412]KQT32371.1 hypothetical protein ASG29_11295 [Sphingomonas sp. Leaf412]